MVLDRRNMPTTGKRSYLVYLLPSLHLCACAVIALAKPDGWGGLFLIDLPFSLLIVSLPWHFPIPPWLAFGTLGTLWWYVLSRLIDKYLAGHPRNDNDKTGVEHKVGLIR